MLRRIYPLHSHVVSFYWWPMKREFMFKSQTYHYLHSFREVVAEASGCRLRSWQGPIFRKISAWASTCVGLRLPPCRHHNHRRGAQFLASVVSTKADESRDSMTFIPSSTVSQGPLAISSLNKHLLLAQWSCVFHQTTEIQIQHFLLLAESLIVLLQTRLLAWWTRTRLVLLRESPRNAFLGWSCNAGISSSNSRSPRRRPSFQEEVEGLPILAMC